MTSHIQPEETWEEKSQDIVLEIIRMCGDGKVDVTPEKYESVHKAIAEAIQEERKKTEPLIDHLFDFHHCNCELNHPQE